ncbi:hypothetical protein P3T37_006983 [Kitasatospora sp. MAA4]|nr:hypothetical protein [Kitasatospora sp. MAA4]
MAVMIGWAPIAFALAMKLSKSVPGATQPFSASVRVCQW